MAPSDSQKLNQALDAFIQTTTMEQAVDIIEQHPYLLSDQADILLVSIIHTARQQGQELTAQALDERRDFIRSMRQELNGNENCEL
jgi:hypothetical protein